MIKFLSRNFGFEKAVFCMDGIFLKDWYADGNMDERVRTGTWAVTEYDKSKDT